MGIAGVGYLCGAVPLAVYAARWEDFNVQGNLGSAAVVASSAVTSVSTSAECKDFIVQECSVSTTVV